MKYPKVYKGYKKILAIWEKSEHPHKEMFVKALRESIEEIEAQVFEENNEMEIA